MTRILRATNIFSKKTPRGTTANAKSASWHSPSQLTRSNVKSKLSIRRLHVMRDPQDPTSNTFSPVMDQFTNNANPRYDPSKAPGSVRKLDGTPVAPKGYNTGHQKVIKQTSFMKRAGKTLKRI